MKKCVFTLAASLGFALSFSLLAPVRAVAQDGDGDDPPSRVARLSFLRGSVSFGPAGTDDWVDAFVNRPMTTGDKLWIDSGSRAALHIGSASINLSQNTAFSFLNLTDNVAQLQLTAGTMRIRVKRLGDDDTFEVDTPNLAFNIFTPGIYKISVNDSGDTTIIEDRRGEGQVTGGGSSFDVYEGDVGTFSGTDELVEDDQDVDYGQIDDFEQWSEQRDHHEDISISAQYVSDEAIGFDDLDDNGGWRPVPEYGTIWFPHTAMVGWAPYHYGHWAYVAPWGYSWVDDAPWGFAPFHYGRWVSVNGAWGWVPCPPRPAVVVYGGPVYVRPMYAPALVAWVGGPGFSIGIGVGGGGGVFAAGVNVAWFPLGPREVFVPSYPVSRNYVTNVNISNTTVNTTVVNNYYNTVVVNKTVNVTNVTYVNQRVPGAVVATSPTAFTSGGSVSKNFVQVSASVVASAPVAAMTPPAVPQRGAVVGGRVAANVRPPAAIQARAVVAKTAPPPPPPSFAQRQQAIQSNGGRPISIAAARKIAPVRTASAAPAVRVAPPAKPAAPRNAPAGKANRAPIQAKNHPASAPQQNGNRPANAQQPANNNRPANAQQRPAENNRPGQAAESNANRPATPPPANNRPASEPAVNNNRPPAQPAANAVRPPAAHPADEQLDQKHQQEKADLSKQQDQERQKVEQQHQEENQQAQKQKADAAKQQQLQQQHQQQLEDLQKKHQQEQQQLQQKQEEEHKQAAQKPAPAKENKPEAKPKDKDDRPPQ
jgi:hypothetical protein